MVRKLENNLTKKRMIDKEYYQHKYEITTHPGLKEFYRLRLKEHSALCAITMVEEPAKGCICNEQVEKRNEL